MKPHSARTGPASSAAAVTPSDSVNLTRAADALYVGSAGNLVAVMNGTAITFSNVPAGTVLPIKCTRVNSTNTTASGIVALYNDGPS